MTEPTPAEVIALKAGELLPCPFCGGEADVIEGAEWFYVTCLGEECFCCLGEGYDRDACPDHIFATEAEAIAAWNTRPAADAGEVRTEVVVEHIETVTGDYMQDEGEPIWRVRIGIQCADFEHEQAARNFAAAIRKLGS